MRLAEVAGRRDIFIFAETERGRPGSNPDALARCTASPSAFSSPSGFGGLGSDLADAAGRWPTRETAALGALGLSLLKTATKKGRISASSLPEQQRT